MGAKGGGRGVSWEGAKGWERRSLSGLDVTLQPEETTQAFQRGSRRRGPVCVCVGGGGEIKGGALGWGEVASLTLTWNDTPMFAVLLLILKQQCISVASPFIAFSKPALVCSILMHSRR